MSKIYGSVAELIGNTPLVELKHIEKKYKLEATILAKLEYLNPAGSVKDRVIFICFYCIQTSHIIFPP